MENQFETTQASEGVAAQDNRIATKFRFWPLVKFALPTMAMALLMAIFKSVDDGLFVSQFVGKDALAAVNLCFPLIIGVFGIAVMFATGGSALVARKIGEGKPEEAKRDFTSVIIISALISALITIPCVIFMEDIVRALGAKDELLEYCKVYGTMSIITTPFSILCPVMEYFYVTAGAPRMGLWSTLVNGAVNLSLDYLFIVVFEWGVFGVALATALGEIAVCLMGFVFYSNKKYAMHFTKPSKNWGHILLHSCKNGMAGLFNSISVGVTAFVINGTMMRLMGSDGVAANAVVSAVGYILISMFIGYSNGVAPVFSYNYGNQNYSMMRRLLKYSAIFLVATQILMVVLCYAFTDPLISLYLQKAKEPELFAVVRSGLHIYCLGFLFSGLNITTSGMFSAVTKGHAASIISVMRNLVLVVVLTLALSALFGIDGVWMANPVGELLSFGIAAALLYKFRYLYLPGDPEDEEEPEDEAMAEVVLEA